MINKSFLWWYEERNISKIIVTNKKINNDKSFLWWYDGRNKK